MGSNQDVRCISSLYKSAFQREPTGVKAALLDVVLQVVPCDVAVWASFSADDGHLYDAGCRGVSVRDSLFQQELRAYLGNTIKTCECDADSLESLSATRLTKLLRDIDPAISTFRSSFFALNRSLDARRIDLILVGQIEERDDQSQIKAKLSGLLMHAQEAISISLTASLERRCKPNAKAASAILTSSSMTVASEPTFSRMLRKHFESWNEANLPFPLPAPFTTTRVGMALMARTSKVGDLVFLDVWETSEVDRLSPREYECAIRICNGLSLKEVALELQVSPSTASTLLQRAMKKLNAQSRRSLRAQLQTHHPSPAVMSNADDEGLLAVA